MKKLLGEAELHLTIEESNKWRFSWQNKQTLTQLQGLIDAYPQQSIFTGRPHAAAKNGPKQTKRARSADSHDYVQRDWPCQGS